MDETRRLAKHEVDAIGRSSHQDCGGGGGNHRTNKRRGIVALEVGSNIKNFGMGKEETAPMEFEEMRTLVADKA